METKFHLIQHGRPSSTHFAIFLPLNNTFIPGDKLNCYNPNTQKSVLAECISISTQAWIEISDTLCLLVYGVNAITIKQNLEKTFPEHKNQDSFRVLILKII